MLFGKEIQRILESHEAELRRLNDFAATSEMIDKLLPKFPLAESAANRAFAAFPWLKSREYMVLPKVRIGAFAAVAASPVFREAQRLISEQQFETRRLPSLTDLPVKDVTVASDLDSGDMLVADGIIDGAPAIESADALESLISFLLQAAGRALESQKLTNIIGALMLLLTFVPPQHHSSSRERPEHLEVFVQPIIVVIRMSPSLLNKTTRPRPTRLSRHQPASLQPKAVLRRNS